MKRIILFAFIAAVAVSLTSCFVTYGDTTDASYTVLDQEPCYRNAEQMYLFFEGENIDFNYKKVGIVTVEGRQYASDAEILDHLKYQAWQNCANGIIGISENYKERSEGVLFSEETEEYYSAKVYSGIAVSIEVNDAFVEQYGFGSDTTFVKYVVAENEHQAERSGRQWTASLIGAIAVVILTFVIAGAE